MAKATSHPAAGFMVMPKRQLGYAGGYMAAGEEMLLDFEQREKVTLEREKKIPVGNNSSVIVDGYSDAASTVCEAWAKIGLPHGAQFDKVMSDAIKMIFLDHNQGRKFRKVLIFADAETMKPFSGRSWMAVCLKELGVEIWLANISDSTRDRLSREQVELRR